MLKRRQIRLKIMQSLYSYYSFSTPKRKNQSEYLSDVNELPKLYYFFLNTLVRLSKFSKDFHVNSKKKFFPTEKDLNPKFYFFENKVVKQILFNGNVSLKLEKLNLLSEELNNAHELDKKVFIEIYKSDIYTDYLQLKSTDYKKDLFFIISIIKEILSTYSFFREIVCEKNVFWVDDFDYVLETLINDLKKMNESKSFSTVKAFKNDSDKIFFIDLFNKTIENNDQFEILIKKKSSNWDIDRIATIDLILIKMGLTELFYMKELPQKVTLNEYIEISKYYGTKNSSKFINGVLDEIIKSQLTK